MGEMIELEDLIIHTDFIQSKKQNKEPHRFFLCSKSISLRFLNLSCYNVSYLLRTHRYLSPANPINHAK